MCLGDNDDADDSDAGDLDNTKLMVLIVMCLMVLTRIILVGDVMDNVHWTSLPISHVIIFNLTWPMMQNIDDGGFKIDMKMSDTMTLFLC